MISETLIAHFSTRQRPKDFNAFVKIYAQLFPISGSLKVYDLLFPYDTIVLSYTYILRQHICSEW